MITQEQSVDIIIILDPFESTIHNYERLLKKLRKNPAYVFQLPTVQLVTVEIESNDEDGEPIYQKPKSTVLLQRKKQRISYLTDR